MGKYFVDQWGYIPDRSQWEIEAPSALCLRCIPIEALAAVCQAHSAGVARRCGERFLSVVKTPKVGGFPNKD